LPTPYETEQPGGIVGVLADFGNTKSQRKEVACQMKTGLILLVVLAFAINLSGQGKGKGKGKRTGDSGQAALVSVVFSDSDRRAIQQWTRAIPPQGLPPGLAKRGELPPGLQKQLQKNGTLPPGLQKKISPFPSDLTRRLDPLPQGCSCDRVFLEGKALIIARATGAILDLINLF
jgi:hypothetical protein